MNKIKQILTILFSFKDKNKQIAAEESVKVKALKQQIEVLSEINDSYADQVRGLSKELRIHQKGNTEDKIIGAVVDFLTGNSKVDIPHQPLETGQQLTNSQLRQIISHIPTEYKNKIKEVPLELLIPEVKRVYPSMSHESISKLKEMVVNGG